jgi:hypothetical protein
MQPFKLEIKQKSVTLKMQTTVNIFSKAEKREREREREREYRNGAVEVENLAVEFVSEQWRKLQI